MKYNEQKSVQEYFFSSIISLGIKNINRRIINSLWAWCSDDQDFNVLILI